MKQSIFSQLSTQYAKPKNQELDMSAWFALVEAFIVIERTLRHDLSQQHAITLPGFDTMMVLSQHPQGLRMTDLAIQLAVTKGNVTSVVQRLENEGWVKREVPVSDKRSQLVSLTRSGKKLFSDIQKTYQKTISEKFRNLDNVQLNQLIENLQQLAAG